MRRDANTKTLWHGEWLLRIVIALAFSIGGFVGQDLYKSWRQGQADRRAVVNADIGALHELAALLDESHRIFSLQDQQSRRLVQLLRQNHGVRVPQGLSYEETFHAMHSRFTAPEAALQRLIRSTTMNSQRRVNLALSAWLERSRAFLYDNQPTPERQALAEQLRILKLQLNQWHDKYDAWIVNDPQRSLVFLADDEAHGAGIPLGLEQAIKAAIARWR
jgi:hypothetical protein